MGDVIEPNASRWIRLPEGSQAWVGPEIPAGQYVSVVNGTLDRVILPAPERFKFGEIYIVANCGLEPVPAFPAPSGQIGSLIPDASLSVEPGHYRSLLWVAPLRWCVGIGF